MSLFDRFRLRSPSIEDVKANLARSATGYDLLQEAEKHNTTIVIADGNQLDPGVLGKITIQNGEVLVLVNEAQSASQMVTTLAHELQHLRQVDTGQYIDANGGNKQEFIQNRLENEAKAETAANQVACELLIISVSGPYENKAKGKDAQWEHYSLLRQGGYSHEHAAAFSEPLWGGVGKVREEYIKDAGREWAEANDLASELQTGRTLSADVRQFASKDIEPSLKDALASRLVRLEQMRSSGRTAPEGRGVRRPRGRGR